MELRKWCWKDMGRYQAVADAAGRSVITVKNWCKGTRQVPSRLTLIEAIETLTDGQVTRYELRPDVYGVKPTTQKRPRATSQPTAAPEPS